MSEESPIPEYRSDNSGVRLRYKDSRGAGNMLGAISEAVAAAYEHLAAHGRACQCGLCAPIRGSVYVLMMLRDKLRAAMPPSLGDLVQELENRRHEQDQEVRRRQEKKEPPAIAPGEPG
jgi:hypothetical protein